MTYFTHDRTPVFERTKAANKTFVGVWFVSTLMMSIVFTNWSYRNDENYDLFSKTEKML